MASNVLFDDNFKMIGYRDKKENRDYYTQEYIEKLQEREKVLREAMENTFEYLEDDEMPYLILEQALEKVEGMSE